MPVRARARTHPSWRAPLERARETERQRDRNGGASFEHAQTILFPRIAPPFRLLCKLVPLLCPAHLDAVSALPLGEPHFVGEASISTEAVIRVCEGVNKLKNA